MSVMRNLELERDRWREMCHQHEKLAEQHERTLAKFRALACNHEPDDPYTTLTLDREKELLLERLAEVEEALLTGQRPDAATGGHGD